MNVSNDEVCINRSMKYMEKSIMARVGISRQRQICAFVCHFPMCTIRQPEQKKKIGFANTRTPHA